MTIEIRDAELEARLQKQLEATGSNRLRNCCCACWKARRSRTAGFWKTEKESKPRYSVALTSLMVEREFLKTG
jgi:hypothetical protein